VADFLRNNGIQILLILVTMIGGWYKFDYRIKAVEQESAASVEAAKGVAHTLAKLEGTLAKLDQRLSDFPLHRHVPGSNDPMYPGGQ